LEQFDLIHSLQSFPDIGSVEEISLSDLPERMKSKRAKLSRACLINIRVGMVEYELVVGQPKEFPQKLPYVHLAHPAEHDFHNHVNYEGDVCYLSKGPEAFINTDNPEAILHKAVYMALKTIEGSAGRDLAALHEEFEGYWVSLPETIIGRCFYEPGLKPESINALCNHQPLKKLNTVIFYKDSIPNEYGYKPRTDKLLSVKAWYIPLCKSVLPPSPDSTLTHAYVRNLLKYVRAGFRNELFGKLTKQKRKRKKRKITLKKEFLLFSQPRPSGKLALFGVFVKGYSNCTFFNDDLGETGWQLYPISILRHYESYLLERGGAMGDLKDVTIAVIGCGAVGSRIVEQLALSGIGNIVIIDNDLLSEDNIYRHVLGGQEIGKNKAEAMSKHLKHRLPYVNVTDKSMRREQWIDKEGWRDVQVIIDATADFTGMREMNKKIVNSNNVLPVVYCWLEACGIGGHAVLVDGKSKGCIECLFEFKDQGPYRRSDFLDPYQNITKDLTGCGGAFTPFSALDSIKTATLAVELALEFIINGRESSYRYWVGENKLAKKSGLKLSSWYEKAKFGRREEVETKFSKRNCPVCGVFE
jgi:molybdopterin/thiamine biosynthesis adenylyltransferase